MRYQILHFLDETAYLILLIVILLFIPLLYLFSIIYPLFTKGGR